MGGHNGKSCMGNSESWPDSADQLVPNAVILNNPIETPAAPSLSPKVLNFFNK